MQFKGDEFIRNIALEKEKVELEKQAQSLEAQKNESIVKTEFEDSSSPFDNDPVIVDIKDTFEDELNDIKLTSHSADSETKKKYIILSIALSILFILTIIIIRLISDDTQKDSLFTTPSIEQIEQDNILDAPNSNEKYEALINKKAKQTIQKELDLKSIAKEEIPLPKVEQEQNTKKHIKEISNDVFGMEKKAKPVVEKIVEKVKEVKKPLTIKKPAPVPIETKKITETPKETIKTQPAKVVSLTKLSGSFVQIGAFTKTPNKTLLQKVTKAGYKYTIHKMNIKGTVYNKVIIGPYKDEAATRKALDKIRKDLNKPKAYILRLK
ncbi:MAG: SPOR domain-containing protein [Arcobacteraceae bacterium]|nr:SPOR domain-containing protein [Arcobacteraceae bacterium]